MTATADTIAIRDTDERGAGPGAAAFACAERPVMDPRGRFPFLVPAPRREAAGVAAC